MTTREKFYFNISVAYKEASLALAKMQHQNYESAYHSVDGLCIFLCNVIGNNFTQEEVCKMYEKFKI